MATPEIGPETTLDDLLAHSPDARAKLRSFGIDTCCGGSLTLAEAGELRGVAIEDLLRAVRPAAAEPSSVTPPVAPPVTAHVTPHDNVRDLLARHPQVAPVLESHGLMGCGGARGPDEPLDLFARIHKVPLDALILELGAAIAHPPEPPRPEPRPLAVATPAASESAPAVSAPATNDGSATLYRRFILGALACTTTLGATFGAYNLFAFHTGYGHASPAHNWSHANFQVMGFVLLFTMGVSYHTLPRFLGSALQHVRLAKATFWLAILGLFVRNYGNLAPIVPHPLVGIMGGSLLQATAVLGWATVLFTTWRRSRAPREVFHDFLVAGTLFWIVSVGIEVSGAIHAVIGQNFNFAARWNEPHYSAALFGGTLLWIQGMFLRTGPFFLGLRPSREGLVESALALGVSGAATAVAGGLVGIGPVGFTLVDAGLVGVTLSVLLYTIGLRVLEPRAEDGEGDRAFLWIMRTAFAAALLFVAVAGLFALSDLFASRLPSLVFDGARHAFALGFVTLSLFGMAGRIVPVFSGARLRWPLARTIGVALIALGILLRETEVVMSLGGPNELLLVSGSSGFVAATGVLLASASIWGTLRAGRAEQALPTTPVALAPDANVEALVATHPEALEILVAAGFAPLANPVLRHTLGRAITLAQACRMHGIDPEAVLVRLRAACPHGVARRHTLPVVG